MAEETRNGGVGDHVGRDEAPDPWDDERSVLPPPPVEPAVPDAAVPEPVDDDVAEDDSANGDSANGDWANGDSAVPDAVDDELELPAWMTKPRPGSEAPPPDASELVSGEGAGLLPAVTSATGGGRADTMVAAIGALSMRVDSLIAATTTYRSVMSDRLTEYADLVNRLNRTQANDLDEFRKANERTVGEIRRTMSDSEEYVRTVSAQSDQLITEIGLLAEFVRSHATDVRELIDSTDKLGRFVTGALDQFAERVLSELRTLSDHLIPELNSLRTEASLIRESLDGLNERASNAPVREAIDELRADFSGLRRAVIEWPDLEVARAEIVAMRADLTGMIESAAAQGDGVDTAAVVDGVRSAFGPQLEAVATDVSAATDLLHDLSARVAALEAREVPASVPSDVVSTEAIESLRDEVKALRRRIQVRAPD